MAEGSGVLGAVELAEFRGISCLRCWAIEGSAARQVRRRGGTGGASSKIEGVWPTSSSVAPRAINTRATRETWRYRETLALISLVKGLSPGLLFSWIGPFIDTAIVRLDWTGVN